VWENVVCWFSSAPADDSARLKTSRVGVLLLYFVVRTVHCIFWSVDQLFSLMMRYTWFDYLQAASDCHEVLFVQSHTCLHVQANLHMQIFVLVFFSSLQHIWAVWVWSGWLSVFCFYTRVQKFEMWSVEHL